MDIAAVIASGLLENYCMGFSSETENAEVERLAALYPEIQKELNSIRSVFEEYLLSNTIAPSPTVKFAVMESVYKQQAEKDKTYFPLLNEHTEKAEIRSWLENNAVPGPDTAFDNLFFLPLPSTPFVTNIMVWAKEGHEKEMHTEYKEYLYLIKGSCTMYYENNAKSYSEGDIITIPTHVDHYAVVTSDFPMIAIVQRQACA